METLEFAQREGRARLHPSLTDPSWLVLRKRREIFQRWIAQVPGRELQVLDVGGRIQPYRPLLEDRARSYVALDLQRTPLVGVVGQAESIPFAGGRFDLVCCAQVLQYVPRPEIAVNEMHRVLKPGGRLLMSVPSIAMRDADQECWRFWPEAIRQLLRGFEQVEILAEGGSITGLFRSMNVCLNIFSRYPSVRWIFRHTLAPVLNVSGAVLESIAHSDNDQFAANYSVLAVKGPSRQ